MWAKLHGRSWIEQGRARGWNISFMTPPAQLPDVNINDRFYSLQSRVWQKHYGTGNEYPADGWTHMAEPVQWVQSNIGGARRE